MANTLTNLTPDLYEALDTVSRELVGMIPAVTLDANAERAAKGQTIRSAVAPSSAAADITPAQKAPDTGDQIITNKTLSISKSRGVAIRYNGEEQRGLNTGPGYNSILQNQFAQAMRTLTNEVETDLTALYAQASNAYGTPGTTPFGTAGDFSDASFALKLLKDNGAPLTGNQLVVSSAAGASMLGLQSRVDVQGNDSMLRQGVMLSTAGMDIRESAQINAHTKGTGASYITNGTFAVGDTAIDIDGGSGTILAGDVITFAGDTNKYVVTSALAAGTVTIAAPGLRESLADGVALTVGNSFTGNVAFHKAAVEIGMRPMAQPTGGDAAVDRLTVQDPVSGLVFEVAAYKGYNKAMFDVSCLYGYKVWKPDFAAVLLG